MRKFLFASVALFALSSAAQAANTSTTVQLGVVNSSSTTQNGLTNDSSSTTQVGLLNGQTTMQGVSSPSLGRMMRPVSSALPITSGRRSAGAL